MWLTLLNFYGGYFDSSKTPPTKPAFHFMKFCGGAMFYPSAKSGKPPLHNSGGIVAEDSCPRQQLTPPLPTYMHNWEVEQSLTFHFCWMKLRIGGAHVRETNKS